MIHLIDKIGQLDFVLITGDIIHQGNYENHALRKQTKELIKNLQDKCKEIVYCIGNHDYSRDNVRFDLLADWQKKSFDSKCEAQNSFAPKLRSNFETTVDFLKSISDSDHPISTRSYVYRKVSGLNIVVLNTSVFSGQPVLNSLGEIVKKDGQVQVDDEGKMWICEEDFPKVSELDYSCPTIVVGHHTLQMFEEHIRRKIIEFIQNLPSKYYFCGHIHKLEDKYIEGIEQLASSGLFKDDYNNPTISIHQMKRNANEHIDTQNYIFYNGDWENLDRVCKSKNTEFQKNENPIDKNEVFIVEKSQVSDGAVQMPYNNGKFNLYITEAKTTDMIAPHMHQDLDEVTYITKGSVYAYIDGKCSFVSTGDTILMPKGKLHSFIPKEYPCEYITMGIEMGDKVKYETEWSNDIEEICKLDDKLQMCSQENISEIYDKLVEHLKASVLEVRWKAIDVLKKYLAQDSDDSTYIESTLQKLVINTIRDRDVEKRLFGINMACEFRTKISAATIHTLMTDSSNYMYAWNCAYYLLKVRTNVDYDNLFSKIVEKNKIAKSKNERVCIYYESIIVSLLQLMIKHKGERFIAVYKEVKDKGEIENALEIDDIIIHFVLWYTSFNYKGEKINYKKAKNAMPVVSSLDSEEIVRGLLSIVDPLERNRVLRICKEENILPLVVKAFFEAYEVEQYEQLGANRMKENIKNYLRIIVSEECNLKCVYCHHEGRIESLIGENIKSNKDFNLRELLIKARECGFTKIKISGGEPLLYKNILAICNEFQNDFEDIGFTTNGTNIVNLISEFEKIKGSKLTFNVTFNSYNEEKYEYITKGKTFKVVQEGIKYLVENGFKVKLNAVITSYNIDDIESLVGFAARMKVNIKLLDLFTINNVPDEFQHVSIAEIKSRLIELYTVSDEDFYIVNDYMCVDAMGIKIMIPKRLYSSDCLYNCKMYPCAEGLFGIRVYEDYSCASCFNGKIYSGGLDKFTENISQIRAYLDLTRLSF